MSTQNIGNNGNNNNDWNNDKNDNKHNTNTPNEMPIVSFAQMEGKCYCCGKPGHKSTTCRAKDKPKPEWAINKAKLDNQSHLQAKTATNDDQVSIHSNRDTQVALDRTIG